ncbi:Glutamate decarboxylase 2 [Coemansia sp. RSA 2607]|nr:Glutamate decarboxylase 2 [Coemansia sp. RSA 2607]
MDTADNADSPDAAQTADELRELLQDAAREFPAYVQSALSRTARIHPDAEATSTLPLELPEHGSGRTGVWRDIRAALDAATNTWNPRFLYKLYAGPTPVGVLSEALLGLLNNNAHVFGASPAGALIEQAVGRRLCELAGMPPGAAGLTFPGGSYANLHALVAARNTRFPECHEGGLWALAEKSVRPVMFTSAHAHYSLVKGAVAAGLGTRGVVCVPTDTEGRMDARALRVLVERHVRQGDSPFFVNATAGTTVLGAFDPLAQVADVCDEYGLWLHIDGSWGGPLLLFGQHPPVPVGRVHSLTINPHKLLGVPLHCSFLLVRQGLPALRSALALGAQYLYHTDDQDEEGEGGACDFGDATLGCGRRPDAVKLWLVWRYHGTQYLRARVHRARDLALGFARMVQARDGLGAGVWRLVAEPQGTTVCFWHVPQHLIALHGSAGSAEQPERWWGSVASSVCRRVNASGGALIDYATMERFGAPPEYAAEELPCFFRIPFNNPVVTEHTQRDLLDLIEQTAAELESLDLI